MERGLDAYRLKLIALLLMIVDHVHTYILWCYTHTPQWISVVTRIVSPLFLYLMIDGFYHTRSRKKFLLRLFAAAFIMLIGKVIINYSFHNVDYITGEYSFSSLTQGNNIFLTLAWMFALVWCMENIKYKKNTILNVFLAIIIAFLSLASEGGFYLLPITVIVWWFHGRKKWQCLGICAWCIILFIKSLSNNLMGNTGNISLYSYMCFSNEWGMFLVVPFILMYNGERGKNTKFTKYLFYVAYPVHLWILMIISYLLEK
ncbi:MAG: hypothetical protein J5802_05135 [Butyrivibrio sp.]|nr:hypothetical protein [Butyrivibrio sp.]